MTKREKKLHGARMKRRANRATAAGFAQLLAWIDKRDLDAIQARARAMKIPQIAVSRAVIRAGMRHLTASEIIREHGRWKDIFGKPAVPRYAGADFDPSLRHNSGPKKAVNA